MKVNSPFYDHALHVLGRSDLFGGLDESIVQDMLQSFRRVTYPKKTVVMDPEEGMQRFFVLLSGRVKIVRIHPDTAKEFTVFLLGICDGFDIIPLHDFKKTQRSGFER